MPALLATAKSSCGSERTPVIGGEDTPAFRSVRNRFFRPAPLIDLDQALLRFSLTGRSLKKPARAPLSVQKAAPRLAIIVLGRFGHAGICCAIKAVIRPRIHVRLDRHPGAAQSIRIGQVLSKKGEIRNRVASGALAPCNTGQSKGGLQLIILALLLIAGFLLTEAGNIPVLAREPIIAAGSGAARPGIVSRKMVPVLPLDGIANAIDGVESSHGQDLGMWRPDLSGPQGPMQISAAAATDVGGGDRFDLTRNRVIGRAYLEQLRRRYRNWPDAIAAYNWGIGKMDHWIKAGRLPDQILPGVVGYVRRVIGDGRLCRTSASKLEQSPALIASRAVVPEAAPDGSFWPTCTERFAGAVSEYVTMRDPAAFHPKSRFEQAAFEARTKWLATMQKLSCSPVTGRQLRCR